MGRVAISTCVLGGLCIFQAGLLIGLLTNWAAHADEPAYTAAPTEKRAGELLCNLFPVGLPETATAGERAPMRLPGTDEPGQWVQSKQSEWALSSTDLEIAQKPTGFPQAWLQVCLTRR